jgi:ANTAR domain/GAF domain
MPPDGATKVLSWVAEAGGDRVPSVGALCAAVTQPLGVDGAGVVLTTESRLGQELLGASNQVAADLEELEMSLGEGPCADAVAMDAPMLVADLQTATGRWPGFAAGAVGLGAAAVFAFPLHVVPHRPLGALTLYRRMSRAMAVDELTEALASADLVQRVLRVRQPPPAEESGPGCVPAARAGRDTVHQAVGMLAVQLGVDLAEALARLRAHAFANDVSLTGVARSVVARELRLS